MTIKADIIKHALDMYPQECVGYVTKGEYHRLDNVSNNPEIRYQLTNKDKLMLFKLGKDLDALVHSHTVLDNTPSEMDLIAQQNTGFTFWIIGTNGNEVTEVKEINL